MVSTPTKEKRGGTQPQASAHRGLGVFKVFDIPAQQVEVAAVQVDALLDLRDQLAVVRRWLLAAAQGLKEGSTPHVEARRTGCP